MHQFAADAVRPAAAEWDEKEEFPWLVVEEAAKVGLYSVDFLVAQAVAPRRARLPITMEELFRAMPASGCRSSAARWPPPASAPTAPTSRWPSGPGDVRHAR